MHAQELAETCILEWVSAPDPQLDTYEALRPLGLTSCACLTDPDVLLEVVEVM